MRSTVMYKPHPHLPAAIKVQQLRRGVDRFVAFVMVLRRRWRCCNVCTKIELENALGHRSFAYEVGNLRSITALIKDCGGREGLSA